MNHKVKISNTPPKRIASSRPFEEPHPIHPCLIPLRSAAKGERQAIAFYLEGAVVECRLFDVFTDIAKDEMHHFVELMRLVSCLDPVQSMIFEESGLNHLVSGRAMSPKWAPGQELAPTESECKEISSPPLKDIRIISLLTKAISDELDAINEYHMALHQTKNPACRELFFHIMNEEKEHVAKLATVLFGFTHEPPLMEIDPTES